MSAGLRFAGRVAAMLLALAVALALHGLWRLCRLPSPWPRLLLGSVARIAGARPQVIGTPQRDRVVFLSNHLSWIDILAVAGATGTCFVAKAELRRAPLVGWLCTLNHTLFVDRADRLGIAGQVERIRAALAGGWPVTLFPEGTTGGGTTLLPFKGALLAALEPPPPGAVVQPVRIDYGPATRDLAWVGDEPGAHHARRVLERAGTFPVVMQFLDPIDPALAGGRKGLAAAARARIEAAERPRPPDVPPAKETHPMPDDDAIKPTQETDRPNLSTEHQQSGDARRPSDTLDRDQPEEGETVPRKSSLI